MGSGVSSASAFTAGAVPVHVGDSATPWGASGGVGMPTGSFITPKGAAGASSVGKEGFWSGIINNVIIQLVRW